MNMQNSRNVYFKTACCCVAAGLLNLALDRLFTPWIHDRVFRVASAFSLLQLAAIACIAVYLFSRRAYNRHQEAIHEQIRPAIQERVMALALAGEAWSTPVPKRGPARLVLEQCLAHALVSLKDSGRDRLIQFACQHGFAKQWLQAFSSGSAEQRKRAVALIGLVAPKEGSKIIQSALQDEHPAVRTEAARALLVTGNRTDVDRVFRSVLREPRLNRALLTSDMKRHAGYLLAHTIPAVIAESHKSDVQSCLEILTVWKLANPGLDIARLLDKHCDGFVLPLVVELLPYVAVEDSMEDRLGSALESTHLEVQCAAARATGQLKLQRLIPALVQLLHQNGRLAVTAATALGQMGAQGARHLETIVRGTDRRAAAVAMEALETLTVGT